MSALWKIEPVVLADGPALGRNNMSAFWEDPSWILVWPTGTELDLLIDSATKRVPRNLLSDRAVLRHQKAVDPRTGALVGYARWRLPDAAATSTEDGEAAWPDAQDGSGERCGEGRDREGGGECVVGERGASVGSLDEKNGEIKERIPRAEAVSW